MSQLTVRFRQSGGIAGLVRGCEISSRHSDATEAKHLAQLVENSGLLNAGAKYGRRKRHEIADAVEYKIDIEIADTAVTVVLTDDDVDERVEPLVRFLQARSKPMTL